METAGSGPGAAAYGVGPGRVRLSLVILRIVAGAGLVVLGVWGLTDTDVRPYGTAIEVGMFVIGVIQVGIGVYLLRRRAGDR